MLKQIQSIEEQLNDQMQCELSVRRSSFLHHLDTEFFGMMMVSG